MTRFFFPASRAHHAYCMAIDHGMKFANRSGFWTPDGLLTLTGAVGYRIEVAEASLHLLEPQVGDVVRWVSSRGEPWEELHHRVVTRGSPELHLFDTAAAKQILSKPELRGSISERNGLAFYSPEQDA